MNEDLRKAFRIFFRLMDEKVISIKDPDMEPYFESGVRDVLYHLQEEAGVQILFGNEYAHMVTLSGSNIFSTSFTSLKRKYSSIENKKYFYLLNLILLVFLVEIDVETVQRIRFENAGITFHQLERKVSETLSRFKERNLDGSFALEWNMAIDEMATTWETTALSDPEGRDKGTGTKQTRIGIIRIALKQLVNEKLIYIHDDTDAGTSIVIPKAALYERLDLIYHDETRYEEIKQLIYSAKEEKA